MKVLGEIVFAIISIVVASLFGGYVLSKLWEWFVVYTFNQPTLSVVNAMGVSLLISYATYKGKKDKEEKDTESFGVKIAASLVEVLLMGGLTLLIGKIIAMCM